MSDFGGIAISKNCQSYPNWHESIFDDWIFRKMALKSLVRNNHFSLQEFWKTFLENEIIENRSIVVGIWLSFYHFKDLWLGCLLPNIRNKYLLMEVLIKVSDQKFRAIKSDVRLWRYCYFKRLSILSQLTWINFW